MTVLKQGSTRGVWGHAPLEMFFGCFSSSEVNSEATEVPLRHANSTHACSKSRAVH